MQPIVHGSGRPDVGRARHVVAAMTVALSMTVFSVAASAQPNSADVAADTDVWQREKLTGDWGGVLDCEVLAIEPERTLSYSWNFNHADPAYGLESVVTFTLTPTAGGTHLRMEQAGFRPDQKQAFGGAHAGWKQFLENLEQLLAKDI